MPRKQRQSLAELNITIEQAEAERARRLREAARILAALRRAGLTLDDLATAARAGGGSAAPVRRRRRRGKKAVVTKAKPAAKRAARRGVRKGRSAKVAPKYRHPSDASLTWTGRGNQPRWMRAWLSEGKGRKLETLRIAD